ncbi:MAG: sodium-dependent transporter [Pseudomonadota bacterium]|nr:sodium-dependent transporter [Pseudomonadota bacterium]
MRAKWGSQIGFILATAGSAIGLGNIWRFPYLAGEYGGGVFLITYLICVVALGYFMLVAKLSFGRLSQTNLVDGFKVAANREGIAVSPIWGWLGGWLGFMNAWLVSAVYVIVIGWTLSYVISGGALLLGIGNRQIDAALFEGLSSSFGRQLFWGIACILITAMIIIKGVKKGIERVSLYLMPFLFVLLLFMVVWMIFLPDSGKGILFFLKPNWERIGFTSLGFRPDLFCDLLLTAFGQAIYSLSLGMGVAFVYGSYLPKNTDIKSSARWIVGLDTLVAFLSGMIVLPAVFAFGLEPGQGPSLSFISLPLIFSKMIGGTFLMFLFFLLLFLAALTSLISIYESSVNLIMDKLSVGRTKATLITTGSSAVGVMLVLASFTKKTELLGRVDLFSLFDRMTGAYTMPLMIFVCCLFMGWKVPKVIIAHLGQGSGHQSKLFKTYLRLVLRYIAPVIMIILFATAFI